LCLYRLIHDPHYNRDHERLFFFAGLAFKPESGFESFFTVDRSAVSKIANMSLRSLFLAKSNESFPSGPLCHGPPQLYAKKKKALGPPKHIAHFEKLLHWIPFTTT